MVVVECADGRFQGRRVRFQPKPEGVRVRFESAQPKENEPPVDFTKIRSTCLQPTSAI